VGLFYLAAIIRFGAEIILYPTETALYQAFIILHSFAFLPVFYPDFGSELEPDF
jgi:hypothetical protein